MGQRLLEARLISEEQVRAALQVQEVSGSRLGSILVEMGAVSESTLLQFLSQQYGVSTIDLSTCQVDAELLRFIPVEIAKKYTVIPVRKTESRLILAMVDPSNTSVLDEIKFLVGVHVVPVVAMESDILSAIHRLYQQDTGPHERRRAVREQRSSQVASASTSERQTQSGKGYVRVSENPSFSFPELQACLEEVTSSLPVGEEAERGSDGGEDRAPVVHLVNRLIEQARQSEASDVHIEPYVDFVRVRFRLDGVLRTVMHLPKSVQRAIVARIKIMSRLNIAEQRLPQDGRMRAKSEGIRDCDIRVSILPCVYGEKVVLRILDRSCLNLDLTQLGFDAAGLSKVMTTLEVPHGMVLVTGPTGSGKTTTLYSALQFLNSPGVNIVTVEDPVEYQIPGINQLQTKDDIGLSFAAGLRSFLRQDPDVIMVGEIRDRETASIAVQAALTGHRVFSTLHTTDAIRAVTRLLDMGIEPFLVSSALSLVIAQRLIRKICEECREPDSISIHQLTTLGFSREAAVEVTPMRGAGCPQCQGTGFKGRIPLFEILSFSDELHDKILQRAPVYEIKACARRSSFNSLRASGLQKIKLGVTTVDEVLAVTSADE
ncbi:MAG: Flp pilus assembly complex ATPase component TadA [Nitrospirales bacterium]|nr:Flp pilus assembly complex ATPase component TadA [Nitrospira sp.]MDR4500449.1 Flp pilus assembly complex ATPase component TadA [Nitrospirales bacterium]